MITDGKLDIIDLIFIRYNLYTYYKVWGSTLEAPV